MKNKTTVLAFAMAASLAVFSSCSKEEVLSSPTGTESSMRVSETTYPLMSVSDPSISGTVTFKKVGNKTKVTIELDGTMSGDSHPAHIHFNSAAVGGGIAVDLSSVNGGSGKSVTIVSSLADGTPISYEQLLAFNGYVNVHLSAQQLAILIAQGDIGSNF